MTPTQLENLPNNLSKIYDKLEYDIMEEIAKSVKVASKLDYSEYLIERERMLGNSARDIKKMMAKSTELSTAEISNMVDRALKIDYNQPKDIYERKQIEFVPLSENKAVMQQAESIKIQTANEFINISNTSGFVQSQDGQVVFEELTDYYRGLMDETVLKISSGAFDYNRAMQIAVNKLTASGIRTIDYASGTTNKIEVATRRSAMTAITQLSTNISVMNAQRLGLNKYEVTAHPGARNTGTGYYNHANWQGKVYTMQELEEICGYGQGGGLAGWNCRHTFFPIDDESPRMYTDEYLKDLKQDENRTKKYQGKDYDLYSATQKQRQIETSIRKQRQTLSLLKDKVSKESLLGQKARLKQTEELYKDFSKKMSIPTQFERTRIY
jgi:hypothetical protein